MGLLGTLLYLSILCYGESEIGGNKEGSGRTQKIEQEIDPLTKDKRLRFLIFFPLHIHCFLLYKDTMTNFYMSLVPQPPVLLVVDSPHQPTYLHT